MSAVTTPCHAAPRIVWNWVQRIVKWMRAEKDHAVSLDMGAGVVVTVTLTHEAQVAECASCLEAHLAGSTLPPARTNAGLKSRAAFVLQPPLCGQTPARN